MSRVFESCSFAREKEPCKEAQNSALLQKSCLAKRNTALLQKSCLPSSSFCKRAVFCAPLEKYSSFAKELLAKQLFFFLYSTFAEELLGKRKKYLYKGSIVCWALLRKSSFAKRKCCSCIGKALFLQGSFAKEP